MTHRSLRTAALLAAPLLFAAAALAKSSARSPMGRAPISRSLEASGRATIYHGDLAGARERAVVAALRQGLERYAGLRIEASTLMKKEVLIDREVRAHTHGFVDSYEVVATRREGAELVADVRMRVAAEPVEEAFRRLLPATTTLLLVREANLGQPVDAAGLASALVPPFLGAKLLLVGEATWARTSADLPASYFEEPDPDSTRELGLRWMSGLVVVARAESRALDSGAGSLGYDVGAAATRPVAAASGQLAILSGATGETIARRLFDDVRGSDATDPGRAGREALDKLGGEMRAFLVDALTRHLDRVGSPLTVTVRGEAAGGGAARVRQILADTRWVERVELEREEEGLAVLRLVCREKPVYVVEELRQTPGLEIVRFDAAAGELELR